MSFFKSYSNTNDYLAHNAVIKDKRDEYDQVTLRFVLLSISEYLFDVQFLVSLKRAKGYVLTTRTEELNCIQFIFASCSFIAVLSWSKLI